MYGTYVNNPAATTSFSVPFANYVNSDLRMMFSSGDGTKYVVTKYSFVTTETGGAALAFTPIVTSNSANSFSLMMR